jgi:phage terminase large subunit
MNTKFYRTVWDHARFNVWKGGAGSGKSVAAAQRYVYRLTAERGHNLMCVRKVGESNRFSTFANLVNVIHSWRLDSLYDISESNLTIRNRFNGNQVIFRGMNDFKARERVKSVTFTSGPLTDIWIEEASELDPDDFRQLNLRLRGQALQPFQILLTFNPISVDHWIKSEFFDNPKLNASILNSTYLDNRFIDRDYRFELESYKVTDPTFYQVYALGEWGQLGDKAFPNAIFTVCPYKMSDFDRVLFGKDFGFQHYDATEGIGLKDGAIYSFRELYVKQKTNPEIISLAEPILPKAQRCTADSAEPKSIAEWNNAGFRLVPAKKGPDSVEAGFAFLRSRPWYIDPIACPGLAAEARGAVYKKDRNGRPTEEIFSFHDDALAGTRYAIEELIPSKKSEAKSLWE